MLIYCIDYKQDGYWTKYWNDLIDQNSLISFNLKVLTLKEFTERLNSSSNSLNHTLLVIIHESALEQPGLEKQEVFNRLKAKTKSLNIQAYILIVSTGKLDPTTSKDGLIHMSGIPFPSQTSLTYLKDSFEVLITTLNQIPCDKCLDNENNQSILNKRQEAWQVWEKSGYSSILSSLSILCQGYLVVHAEYNGSDKDWQDQDIETALEKMGWTNDFLETTGQLLGLSDLSSQIDKVREPKWWSDVFENPGILKKAVTEEWENKVNSSLPSDIELLVEMIINQTQIKPPKTVARAYSKISSILTSQKVVQ